MPFFISQYIHPSTAMSRRLYCWMVSSGMMSNFNFMYSYLARGMPRYLFDVCGKKSSMGVEIVELNSVFYGCEVGCTSVLISIKIDKVSANS